MTPRRATLAVVALLTIPSLSPAVAQNPLQGATPGSTVRPDGSGGIGSPRATTRGVAGPGQAFGPASTPRESSGSSQCPAGGMAAAGNDGSMLGAMPCPPNEGSSSLGGTGGNVPPRR